MMYTVMDLNTVFDGKAPVLEEYTQNGVLMLGTRSGGMFYVARVVSSNPLVYLDPQYQVGASIPITYTK